MRQNGVLKNCHQNALAQTLKIGSKPLKFQGKSISYVYQNLTISARPQRPLSRLDNFPSMARKILCFQIDKRRENEQRPALQSGRSLQPLFSIKLDLKKANPGRFRIRNGLKGDFIVQVGWRGSTITACRHSASICRGTGTLALTVAAGVEHGQFPPEALQNDFRGVAILA